MAQRFARVFGSRLAVAITAVIMTAVVLSGGLSALAQEVAELAAPNSVDSAAIINGTIVGTDIATNGVNSRVIKENGIHTNDIRDGDVISGDIANDSITSSDIGADSVGSSELGSNVVGNTELGTITQRSQVSASIAAGGNGSATATCLAGEQVLSGGNDGFFEVFVVASRQSGNGWAVFAHNSAASARTITAHVYCLQP